MHPGVRSHHDLLGQGGQKGISALVGLRLADKIHCAGRQGVKYPQVEGRHQDDRNGVSGQQLLQEIKAAFAGHLYIQRHHIGLEAGQLVFGIQGVDSIARHLDQRVGGKAGDQQIAGHDGIIHHHDADLLGFCRRRDRDGHAETSFVQAMGTAADGRSPPGMRAR